METLQHSCQQIYETLAESLGTKCTLTFPDENKAEQFRVRMFQTKKKSEEHLISIGFMEEDDCLALSVKKDIQWRSPLILSDVTLTLILTPRIKAPKFEVVYERPAPKTVLEAVEHPEDIRHSTHDYDFPGQTHF